MTDFLAVNGQASTMGLMMTSMRPPPTAYTADARNSPTAGGRMPGSTARSTNPVPASRCAATAQGR